MQQDFDDVSINRAMPVCQLPNTRIQVSFLGQSAEQVAFLYYQGAARLSGRLSPPQISEFPTQPRPFTVTK
jgi:hypothetical protein